jgi:hypothetical protein
LIVSKGRGLLKILLPSWARIANNFAKERRLPNSAILTPSVNI